MRTVKIAAASVLMATALYGCSKGGEAPAPQAPPVTVALPLARQIVDWDEVTGRFEAPRTVDVRARVGGYIQSVHFKDGDEQIFLGAEVAADEGRIHADVARNVAHSDVVITVGTKTLPRRFQNSLARGVRIAWSGGVAQDQVVVLQ